MYTKYTMRYNIHHVIKLDIHLRQNLHMDMNCKIMLQRLLELDNNILGVYKVFLS